MCMSRRRFLWPGTIKLCWTDKCGGKRLTKRWTVRYAQNQDRKQPFINVTTVLPASGRAGLHAEGFSGSPE